MSDSGVLLRLLAAVGALALGAAAAAIVGVLAHRTPGPAGAANAPTTTAEPAGTQQKTFPVPPPGAVVFARPLGENVLALGVVPGRKLLLQASVLGSQGQGVDGLRISFGIGPRSADAESCGAGCYRAELSSRGAPKGVDVQVAGAQKTTWRVPMPQVWPPPDGSALVARASRTFRKLKTLAIRDSLAHGPEPPLVTRWTIVAPNRLTYQIKNGPAAVIIGNRRWDKVPGQKWEESEQTPIHQPTPFWVSWTDVHVLETTRTAWRISFFDPKTPGWYEVVIARRSMRPLDALMYTTSHFMHEEYQQFNAPLKITPP